MNFWPPFLGAGISVRRIAPDWSEVDVAMPLRWYNRNYVRTHFGGSLYAMTDPFYMLMLMHRLGREYIVWDQAAEIEYVSPPRSTVHARFRVTPEMEEDVRRNTVGGAKYLPQFPIDVTDEDGNTVARVRRTLYVRLKERARPPG
jgi:acyl-coenzyme A thioesterase PaaI-like protein